MAGLQAFDQHANNDAGATVKVTNLRRPGRLVQ